MVVEIGPDSIRLAEFSSSSDGRLELLDVGLSSLAPPPQVEMTKDAVVATTLKRLLDSKGLSVRSVEVALDGQTVFSRRIKLPSVTGKKLKQALRDAAVQNIPFPIDEVVWDYQLAGQDEVLLVAVKADLATGMAHAVQATGLSLSRIDVAPAALANAVRYTYPDLTTSTLVVDFGAVASSLIFIDGDRTFFRSLPVPGNRMDRILQEVERSITFYRTQQEGRTPERMLLAGSIDGLDEPERQLSERLKVSVEIFDPLQRVMLGPKAQDAVRHSLGVLVGLAARRAMPSLSGISLMPEPVLKARSLRRREPVMVACILMAALMAGAGAVGLAHLTDLGRWELSGVSKRVAELEVVERELAPLEREVAMLDECSQVYCDAVKHRTVWLEALLELRGQLPEGMFLLATEPMREGDLLVGMRITLVSYLDKESENEDAVILLRDRLRARDRFSGQTSVSSRPSKERFARRFMVDLFLREPMIR